MTALAAAILLCTGAAASAATKRQKTGRHAPDASRGA